MTDELSRKPGDPIKGCTQFVSSVSADTICARCRHTFSPNDEVIIVMTEQEFSNRDTYFLTLMHQTPCPITRKYNLLTCDIEEHDHKEYDPSHTHIETTRFGGGSDAPPWR